MGSFGGSVCNALLVEAAEAAEFLNKNSKWQLKQEMNRHVNFPDGHWSAQRPPMRAIHFWSPQEVIAKAKKHGFEWELSNG